MNVLGELEGFVDSQCCDVNIIVGDFNVDFDRGGAEADLLNDFAAELDLLACDSSFRESVMYTYERDDGIYFGPGLITFSVLGPFPHLFQMCILCVQIAYYQITTHCVFL